MFEQPIAHGKVVTVTAYRRPEYTRRVIEALLKCAGIDEYLVLFHIEPGCREVVDLARAAPFLNKMVLTNAAVLGCTANTFSAIDHAFRFADFVVHLEDDTVPAGDCLRYFEWARHTYRQDPDVFSVTSYCRGVPPSDRHYAVHREPWFNAWGVAFWSDRWQELRDRWGFEERVSWDICANRIRGNRIQIQPFLARTQNIGAEQGTYCPGAEWHRQNQFNEYGAWSVDLDPTAPFQEVRGH
jgi:hypothetical protein